MQKIAVSPRMMLRALMLGALVLLLWFPISLRAQAGVTASATAITSIPSDRSAIVLNGPWKFRTGDSPMDAAGRSPLWSLSSYDDSAWQNYLVDPARPGLTPLEAIQLGMLPGWQRHGHPGYTGYAWYRIRLQPPRDAKSLSLLFYLFDDSLQIYADGRKIGSYGTMGSIRGVYIARPVIFRIPEDLLRSEQPVTLAIRFWNDRVEALPSYHNQSGGLRAAPITGPQTVLEALQKYLPSPMYGKYTTQLWIMLSLHGAVGLICLFLFLFSRSQREYLWTAIALLAISTESAVSIGVATGSLSLVFFYVSYSLSGWAAGSSAPMAVMYLLQTPKDLWRRCTYVVSGLVAAYLIAGALVSLGLLPPTLGSGRAAALIKIVTFVAASLLLLGIVVDGLRTWGRRAWLPLTPGLFVVSALASAVIRIANHSSSLGTAWLVCWYCFPLAILFVFLVRFSRQQRENAMMAGELEAARSMQSLLVPAVPPNTPGFSVESVYLPASQVGGDFFRILPGENGSLLIVVGDVSGKGLKAAMTVSTIVGALRNESSREPALVLKSLNRVLHGQIKGFATCCIALISADGAMTVSNAGHLSPYRNGEEMEVNGDLPLGVIADSNYAEARYTLAPGDRLTFVSDGVVEARNHKGELHGFERTREISAQPAAAIAEMAQRFGQEDDITVVSVEYIGAAELLATPALAPA